MKTDNNHFIEKELLQFKRKYWFAKLIQGILIFAGTGLVLAGMIALFEYVSWMSSQQRTWLFFITLLVELGLFLFYVVWPFVQIIFSGKALNDETAAALIGQNLKGVDDRLTNYLELKKIASKSDLVDASLMQKQNALSTFQFARAVKWSSLKPFTLFLIPLMVFLLFMWSGNRWFMLSQGAERLVNYNVTFERELPFSINFLDELRVEEGENFQLNFSVSGNLIPEELTVKSNRGTFLLTRQSGNKFVYQFDNCLSDVDFQIQFNDISSQAYKIDVIKKAAVGRVGIKITPPSYTNLSEFDVENSRVVEVPQFSDLELSYSFKNTQQLEILSQSGADLESHFISVAKPFFSTKADDHLDILAKADDAVLNHIKIKIIPDERPNLEVMADSTTDGISIKINANDDYRIKTARVNLMGTEGEIEPMQFAPKGSIFKTNIPLSRAQISVLSSIEVLVTDQFYTVKKTIDLQRYKEKTQTESDLLNSAGDMIKKMAEESENITEGSKSEKQKKQQNQQIKELQKAAKELTKKDSTMYERFEKLSEEINKLAEKLDQDIPESQKQISKEKLEEKISELEKEWMILQTIEKLESMEDSLQKNEGAIDERQMKDLQKNADDLQQKMKGDKKSEEVDWEKFENLEKKNEELKSEDSQTQKESDAENKKKESGENSEMKEENKEGEEKDEREDAEKENSPKQKPTNKIKNEMKDDSESLRMQLAEMSDIMATEAAEANVELLRRLELRSLKASKKQEEVYALVNASNELNRMALIQQKEVSISAKGVLDSLVAVTVSDPKMAMILDKYQSELAVQLSAMQESDIANTGLYNSNQRYLQYSLNDLAAILYDILKAESKSMMESKGGNKNCNNPKPGKGKKPSMSEQQKMLGEKMGKTGKKPKPGKGKNGKQTMSQSELLELIKGQEAIIQQYEQKGGKKAGDGKLAEELNKQLDDLINNNIEKALERNKSIEDKLIALEKSENEKEEKKEQRHSKENELDYDAIRKSIVSDYLKHNQSGSSIVNLPALKNYYSGKWIQMHQK